MMIHIFPPPPEAVSKLDSTEEERWTTGSSLLKALKAAANIKKETTWEKLGSTGMGSPSAGTLLHFKGNEICTAVVTLVPGVVIFEHNLAHMKLESVKFAQSCCSRSQVSSSSTPFPVAGNVWTSSVCDDVEMCLTSGGTPAAQLFPRVRGAGAGQAKGMKKI